MSTQDETVEQAEITIEAEQAGIISEVRDLTVRYAHLQEQIEPLQNEAAAIKGKIKALIEELGEGYRRLDFEGVGLIEYVEAAQYTRWRIADGKAEDGSTVRGLDSLYAMSKHLKPELYVLLARFREEAERGAYVRFTAPKKKGVLNGDGHGLVDGS